jgi:hypothetical protein
MATQPGWRYRVRCCDGFQEVEECHLRAIYDGEKLSTWEKFTKRIGVDIRKPAQVRRRTKTAA